MGTRLRALLRDERGLETVEWMGVTGVVLVVIAITWAAFAGGPGRALRATIQDQVFRYANGFEGGLSTSGPGGRRPGIGNPPLNLNARGTTPPAQVRELYDSVTQTVASVDTSNGRYLNYNASTGVRTRVSPADGLQVSVDPDTALIALVDAQNQVSITINPLTNQATSIDAQGATHSIDLDAVRRLGYITIAYGNLSGGTTWWQSLPGPATSIPELFR